jgi:uncharacterized protein (DUF849 family)
LKFFALEDNVQLRNDRCRLFRSVPIMTILIQAALNGSRSRNEHADVPITPEELARSAKECVAAGAGALHVHVRAPGGRESVAPIDVAAAVVAVRRAVPATPLGVSTGIWIEPDAKRRYDAVAHWEVLPDYASVNFQEEGAQALAELLLSRGVGIEVGFTSTAGIDTFIAGGLAPRCLRVLLEPGEQTRQAALENLAQITTQLDAAGILLPRLLHGMNAVAWDMIDAAAARGYHTRVGFEDVLALPDGSSASSNAALILEAVRRMHGPRARSQS